MVATTDKERLDVLAGVRGDRPDHAVRWRDLTPRLNQLSNVAKRLATLKTEVRPAALAVTGRWHADTSNSWAVPVTTYGVGDPDFSATAGTGSTPAPGADIPTPILGAGDQYLGLHLALMRSDAEVTACDISILAQTAATATWAEIHRIDGVTLTGAIRASLATDMLAEAHDVEALAQVVVAIRPVGTITATRHIVGTVQLLYRPAPD